MSTWPEKSGSMRYRPEQMQYEKEQLQISIQDAYTSIYQIDSLIEHYAYALEIIQPSATGKVAIRFLKRSWGGSEGRHPQFIQWYKSRNERFLYNRYKPNEIMVKVKSYPIFAPVEQEVKLILREAIALINHREMLLTTINNFKRQIASVFKRSESFKKEKESQIMEWLPQLKKHREELLKQWNSSIESAHNVLPAHVVPNQKLIPKFDITGRTRGDVL